MPFTYLGLPVEGNPRLKNFWTSIVEKIERRMAGWGRKYLSSSGRVTLIKSVLTNLPTYFLSIFEVRKWISRDQGFLKLGGGCVKEGRTLELCLRRNFAS